MARRGSHSVVLREDRKTCYSPRTPNRRGEMKRRGRSNIRGDQGVQTLVLQLTRERSTPGRLLPGDRHTPLTAADFPVISYLTCPLGFRWSHLRTTNPIESHLRYRPAANPSNQRMRIANRNTDHGSLNWAWKSKSTGAGNCSPKS